MPQHAATIESLPMAFEFVKASLQDLRPHRRTHRHHLDRDQLARGIALFRR